MQLKIAKYHPTFRQTGYNKRTLFKSCKGEDVEKPNLWFWWGTKMMQSLNEWMWRWWTKSWLCLNSLRIPRILLACASSSVCAVVIHRKNRRSSVDSWLIFEESSVAFGNESHSLLHGDSLYLNQVIWEKVIMICVGLSGFNPSGSS